MEEFNIHDWQARHLNKKINEDTEFEKQWKDDYDEETLFYRGGVEPEMSRDEAINTLQDIHSNMVKWKGVEGRHYTDLLGKAIDALTLNEDKQ